MMKRSGAFALTLVLACLLLCSCTSVIDLSNVTSDYRSGHFDGAREMYESQKSSIISTQGEIVYNLDYGMLSMMSGDLKASNLCLDAAETAIADGYTKSITQNIGSYLMNDNAIEYAGEDYEDIYINIFKALNYYSLGSAEDAMVELRRSAEKQSRLQSRYDQQYSQVKDYVDSNDYSVSVQHFDYDFSTSALSSYLMMTMSRSMKDYNTFEVARKQVTQAFATQSSLYDFSLPSFLSSETYDMDSGTARLNIIAFSGLAPIKEQREEYVDMPNGDIGKLAYPVLVSRGSSVRSVKISVDGKNPVPLELIENLDSIVRDTFQPKQQLAISKTILRSYLKNAATQVYDNVAKDKDTNETLSMIFQILGSITRLTNVISEQADVRCSHFLPSKAWATGITLKPGKHAVSMMFCDSLGRILGQSDFEVEVREGETNLIESVSAN